MKLKLLFILFIFLLFLVFVIAEEDTLNDEDFDKLLDKDFKGGTVHFELQQAFLNNQVTSEQKARFVDSVLNLDRWTKESFWHKWRYKNPNGLSLEEKQAMYKGMDEETAEKFMNSFGEDIGEYSRDSKSGRDGGVTFTGSFKDMNFYKNLMGNKNFLFDPEKMREYNDDHRQYNTFGGYAYSDESWSEFKSTKEKTEDGKDINVYRMTKKNGDFMELKVNANDPGYHFDPETGQFRKLAKDVNDKLIYDKDTKLNFRWDLEGQMTVDATGEKLRFDVKFARDENGELRKRSNGKYIAPTLKFADGRKISGFLDYKKDADREYIYNKEKKEWESYKRDGFFTLNNDDGSLSSITNLRIGDKKNGIIFAGFGGDTEYLFFDSPEDIENAIKDGTFDAKTQGYFMVDSDADGEKSLKLFSPQESLFGRLGVTDFSGLSEKLNEKAQSLSDIRGIIEANVNVYERTENLQLKATLERQSKILVLEALGIDTSSVNLDHISSFLVTPQNLDSLSSLIKSSAGVSSIADSIINIISKNLPIVSSGSAEIYLNKDFNADTIKLLGLGSSVHLGLKGKEIRGTTIGPLEMIRELPRPSFPLKDVSGGVGVQGAVDFKIDDVGILRGPAVKRLEIGINKDITVESIVPKTKSIISYPEIGRAQSFDSSKIVASKSVATIVRLQSSFSIPSAATSATSPSSTTVAPIVTTVAEPTSDRATASLYRSNRRFFRGRIRRFGFFRRRW